MSLKTPILCVICLEHTTAFPSTTKCGHKFHKKCIKPWADKYNSCPICRKPLNRNKPVVKCISSFITDDDHDVALRLQMEMLLI
jgi:hypothetical protein